MIPWQIDIKARRLKMSNMWMNKCMKKGKELLSDIVGKGMLVIITGEASKDYKKKNEIQNYLKG